MLISVWSDDGIFAYIIISICCQQLSVVCAQRVRVNCYVSVWRRLDNDADWRVSEWTTELSAVLIWD